MLLADRGSVHVCVYILLGGGAEHSIEKQSLCQVTTVKQLAQRHCTLPLSMDLGRPMSVH